MTCKDSVCSWIEKTILFAVKYMKVLYLIPGLQQGNSFIFSKREMRSLGRFHNVEILPYYIESRNPFRLLHQLLLLRSFIIRNKIDIIHAQYGSLISFIGFLVCYRRKLVITFRGSDLNGSLDVSFVRRILSVYLSYVGLAFADGCIFVSASLKNACPKIYKKSIIIPSGVDLEEFYPQNQKEKIKQLNLNVNSKYLFFYNGNGSKNKRADLADDAIKILHSRGVKNVELLTLSGSVPANLIPDYINASDLLLMLSDREGSPTVVQEALATGTPVVAVQVGDTVEMLLEVKNSRIVMRNAEAIADGIIEVLKIGKELPSKEILNRLDSKNCVSKIYDFYLTI